MSSGFQSNYNDSGYTLTGSWYDASGNLITGSISSRDIYTTSELTGVYMIDGGYNGGYNYYYPFFCSVKYVVNMGVTSDTDDAWLVYPGFGFTIYSGDAYTGVTAISRNYVNTSSVPVVYYCNSGGWSGYGTPILKIDGTGYPANVTGSARIYFRGREIFVNGIS